MFEQTRFYAEEHLWSFMIIYAHQFWHWMHIRSYSRIRFWPVFAKKTTPTNVWDVCHIKHSLHQIYIRFTYQPHEEISRMKVGVDEIWFTAKVACCGLRSSTEKSPDFFHIFSRHFFRYINLGSPSHQSWVISSRCFLCFLILSHQSSIVSVRIVFLGKGVEMAAIASIAGDVGNVEFRMLGCCR